MSTDLSNGEDALGPWECGVEMMGLGLPVGTYVMAFTAEDVEQIKLALTLNWKSDASHEVLRRLKEVTG